MKKFVSLSKWMKKFITWGVPFFIILSPLYEASGWLQSVGFIVGISLAQNIHSDMIKPISLVMNYFLYALILSTTLRITGWIKERICPSEARRC